MRKHYPLNSNGAEDAGKLPWIDGVPSTGVEGSYPGSALFVDTEAEILAAIDAAGLVRSGSDLTQLVQAMIRGLWVGQFGGTAGALTATLPNSLVLPQLLPGMRVRGIAAFDFTTTGGTLKITGVGAAANSLTCPLVAADGVTVLTAGAWKAGQFLTFDIDGSGNARFGGSAANSGSGSGGGSGSGSSGLIAVAYLTAGSGSILVPALATRMRAIGNAAGGGGGGSTGNPSGGTGGGGGGYFDAFVTGLTPGQSLAYAVGAGGAGGYVGNGGPTGGTGGATGIGPYATANGGTGGYTSGGIGSSDVGQGGAASLGNGVSGETRAGQQGGSTYGVINGGVMSGYGGSSPKGGTQSPWGTQSGTTPGPPGNGPGGGGGAGIIGGAGGRGADGALTLAFFS